MSRIVIDSQAHEQSTRLENDNLRKERESLRMELNKLRYVNADLERGIKRRDSDLENYKTNHNIRTEFIDELIENKHLKGKLLRRAKDIINHFIVKNACSYAMAE